MAELALVLIIKQKDEFEKHSTNSSNHELMARDNIRTKTEIFSVRGNTQITPIKEMKHEGRTFQDKQILLLTVLPLTTKIDAFAFIIFNLSFFVFNCVYWTMYL